MGVIVGKGFIITTAETAFICPICERPEDGEDIAEALHKSKRCYIYRKCRGCKRKLFITSDIKGNLVVSEKK